MPTLNTLNPLTAPVLMIVHAHPDDESSQTGGTLARYSAAGVQTVLVTCTDGAQGDDDPPDATTATTDDRPSIAARRSRELRSAASILGIDNVIELGYSDSGHIADQPAHNTGGAFCLRPIQPLIDQMAGIMHMHRPDVIVTYPPNGLSGHPDHIRTHDVVRHAHRRILAATEDHHRGAKSRSANWKPRLYHIALSLTQVRSVTDLIGHDEREQLWAAAESMAIDDSAVTTTIDVTAFWQQKLDALAAHASQRDAAGLARILRKASASSSKVEQYVRIHPAPTTNANEDDLFATVTGA